jgi:hypothetical protein
VFKGEAAGIHPVQGRQVLDFVDSLGMHAMVTRKVAWCAGSS